MLRAPSPQQYQFETITLDELVPEDHLVRKIDATIDFEFIRDAVVHLYCPDNASEGFGHIADRFTRNFATKHPDIAAEARQFINEFYCPVIEMH